MAIVRNHFLKILLFSLGLVALILGVIGIFLPLLPTTPFVLLAAWCFMKSSTRAHQWLYRQPLISKSLRDWERNQSISRRTKILAVAMIAGSAIVIWFKVDPAWIKISVYLLFFAVVTFIITRNEPET